MRKTTAAAVSFAGFGLATLVFAQPGAIPFGKGGGGSDPTTLLRNESVKKELELTEEQTEKIPDAVLKALGEVLNEKQLKRLRQIELQQRGNQAFRDPKIQKQLKISEEQASNIKTVLEDAQKEMADAFKGGDFKAGGEKIATLRKETTDKVMGVLTAEQRKAYKQLIGDEFKMERGGFRFPGGGGNKKKEKDNIQE